MTSKKSFLVGMLFGVMFTVVRIAAETVKASVPVLSTMIDLLYRPIAIVAHKIVDLLVDNDIIKLSDWQEILLISIFLISAIACGFVCVGLSALIKIKRPSKIFVRVTCIVLITAAIYWSHQLKYAAEVNALNHKYVKTPKYFKGHQFHDLSYAREGRNWLINRFYEAHENNETYGVFEIVNSIDELTPIYWFTENGKLTRLVITDAGFLLGKRHLVHEMEDLKLLYWNDEDQVVEVEPQFIHKDLILKANVKGSKPLTETFTEDNHY